MKLSIIIPCYNEEGNIQQCLRRIPELGIECEYVVVDDGSQDQTRRKVLEAMKENPRVRLAAFDRNQGKAKAVKSGIEQARGEIVMILDADMTVRPEDIPVFLDAALQKKNALVMGTRFVYPFDKKAMRWINRISNRITAWLFSKFLKTKITDTLCGTKVLWREKALQMPLGRDRWGDFDFLVGAGWLGLEIIEVPIRYQPRLNGKSSMKAFPDGFVLFKNCLRAGYLLNHPPQFSPSADSSKPQEILKHEELFEPAAKE
ncbi:MAG: glycosyltransferase family 2 protein [Candidatus Omnitrophica bacterium]|nr:glycosyltransferase family 2 protein [Candidatus Omnitrophota bacterium]